MIEGIPNPSRTADNILETSLTPVELLDILGYSGHRVVGVSSKNNKMVNYLTLKLIIFETLHCVLTSLTVGVDAWEGKFSWRTLTAAAFGKSSQTDWFWLIVENRLIFCEPLGPRLFLPKIYFGSHFQPSWNCFNQLSSLTIEESSNPYNFTSSLCAHSVLSTYVKHGYFFIALKYNNKCYFCYFNKIWQSPWIGSFYLIHLSQLSWFHMVPSNLHFHSHH